MIKVEESTRVKLKLTNCSKQFSEGKSQSGIKGTGKIPHFTSKRPSTIPFKRTELGKKMQIWESQQTLFLISQISTSLSNHFLFTSQILKTLNVIVQSELEGEQCQVMQKRSLDMNNTFDWGENTKYKQLHIKYNLYYE